MRIAGGTAKRITRRIINFILVIWGVVTLSFCLQVFTGTDPAEMIVRKVNVFATEEQIQAVREELGLDAPFLERYTDYIKGVLTGDLGTAITNRQPVIENIKDALPVTCMLVVSPLFRAASKVAMLIPSNLAASFREINFSIGGPPFCQRCGCCFQNHMNALATEAASAWYLTLKNLLATFATHPWRWGHSGLRWRGCHNSTASFYSCAAEFPPSL